MESFVKSEKHLPGIPSAQDVQEKGIELGEMNKILLKKIEELTLHVIELDKSNRKQQDLIYTLQKKVK